MNDDDYSPTGLHHTDVLMKDHEASSSKGSAGNTPNGRPRLAPSHPSCVYDCWWWNEGEMVNNDGQTSAEGSVEFLHFPPPVEEETMMMMMKEDEKTLFPKAFRAIFFGGRLLFSTQLLCLSKQRGYVQLLKRMGRVFFNPQLCDSAPITLVPGGHPRWRRNSSIFAHPQEFFSTLPHKQGEEQDQLLVMLTVMLHDGPKSGASHKNGHKLRKVFFIYL